MCEQTSSSDFTVLAADELVYVACSIRLLINFNVAPLFIVRDVDDSVIDHDIKLHPLRVKLCRIGCLGSGLVLAKAPTS